MGNLHFLPEPEFHCLDSSDTAVGQLGDFLCREIHYNEGTHAVLERSQSREGLI